MRYRARPNARVLAIDPTSRGFGFSVLEGADRLIDWGVVHARTDKRARTLKAVAALIDRYHPEVLVVEDASGSRRCARIRALLRSIAALASKKKVKLAKVPRRTVKEAFASTGTRTKHQIAVAIGEHFPELAPRLPPKRKFYESDDERMRIFGATALASAFFDRAVGICAGGSAVHQGTSTTP